MLTSIIRNIICHKLIVLVLLGITVLISLYYIRSAPLDAIPDISDAQIIIYAKWERSPDIIEDEITNPLVQSLLTIPLIKSVRATTNLGYSFIYIIIDEIKQRELLRQIIQNRINAIRYQLPEKASIVLAPNASSIGWIYQYALIDKTKTHDLRELRTLNESFVKPGLQRVSGIAEVATVGGLERQIELKIFPPLLEQAGITLRQIINSLRDLFQEVGGRTIEITNRDYNLRAVVNIDDLDSIEHLIIGYNNKGTAVLLKDIGYLQVNYDIRRGIAELDGDGEVVGGIVIMEQQQNVLSVTETLKKTLKKIQHELPKGVEIIMAYDRSSLIWSTLKNFTSAIIYELFVVFLVILWALRNGRSAVAPVVVILLGCLYTLVSLSFVGQTINLFSLAGLAIAIGEMADATIVIVENCSNELAKANLRNRLSNKDRNEIIIKATSRLMRPLLFSLLIILVSFLPVFFLEHRESRLFDPLAFSKTFAMGFSTLLTLVLLPILISWIFARRGHVVSNTIVDAKDNKLVCIYRYLLNLSIQYRYWFISLSIAAFIGSVFIMIQFDKDYMPEMEEGSILYMPTTLPGMPIREAGWILQQIDKKIKAFPEVEHVFGKLGRADTATDPSPVTMIESTILLKPKSQWRKGLTKILLVNEMNDSLKITGFINSWTQPIAGRIVMQDTGIQTPVGIKVKGLNIIKIEEIAKQVELLLQQLPQTQSVIAERISEGYFIDIENNLERMAKLNVSVDDALLTARYGIGGDNLFVIKQADSTSVPFSMQYSPEYVDTLDKVKRTPVITNNGRSVEMNKIADIGIKKLPEMIRNDNGELAGYIRIDIQDVTAVDYVNKAKKYLQQKLKMPVGYTLEWTGAYQYAQAANARLLWIVPITLIIMFVLLFVAFRSVAESLLILLSAPFALIGGVIIQWWQGFPVTTAVIIGYIAVLAIALQTGILMIEFIRSALQQRTESESYISAIVTGSVARLRPKLMTVATTVLGLIPILLVTGSGMDVTQPIAAPSVGGMVSSTIYVLFLIPCLYVVSVDIRNKWQAYRQRV